MARARATRYRKIFAVMSVDVVRAPGRKAARMSASARDQAIKHIAEQLEACVRATDTLARIGNENFAIILEDLSEPGHAERVKQHVQEALGEAAKGGVGASEVDIRLDFYPGPRQTPSRRCLQLVTRPEVRFGQSARKARCPMRSSFCTAPRIGCDANRCPNTAHTAGRFPHNVVKFVTARAGRGL